MGLVLFSMDRDDIVIAIEALSNSRMRGVLDALHLGILIEDENRQVKLVNRAFLDMFKVPLSAQEFAALNCDAAAQGAKNVFKDEEGFIRGIRERISDKSRVVNELLELQDGRFLHRHYYPLFVDADYRGHAWVYADVTDSIRMERELQLAATTDTLTGLKNRRQLETDFNRQLTIARRYSRPLSMVLCDIDHFKHINDHFGHQFGDAVLKAISAKMVSLKREADIVGRWGGEEFLWVLPETDLAAAANFAERLRSAIQSSDLLDIGYTVTISAGIHQCNAENELSTAVSAADHWLYAAKAAGRNRVLGPQDDAVVSPPTGLKKFKIEDNFTI